MTEFKKILIIIPAFNEAGIISTVVENIQEISKKFSSQYRIDYLVINDGSTDETANILRNTGIEYINLVNNLGIGGCVQTGYKYAHLYNYDIAVQFDGDNQHFAEDLCKIIEAIIRRGADLAIGSRFIEDKKGSSFKTSFMRRVGIGFLSKLIWLITGTKITDVTSGFRGVNKLLIKDFAEYYPSDYPEPETICSAILKKYKVTEVPVRMRKRTTGKSSIVPIQSIYYMIKVSLAVIMTKAIIKKQLRRKNAR